MINSNNIVPTEMLWHYVEYFNKQKGNPYPCSNQTVVCAIITLDRDKAMSVMKEKGATIKRQSQYFIEWEINNERWVWRDWNDRCRGYRFYKVFVDKNIDEELFLHMRACCDIYCCQMEVI